MQSQQKCASLTSTRRSLAGLSAFFLLAGIGSAPARAQDSSNALEILGKAQSKSEKQSVEDLINKLQSRSDQRKDNPPVAAPQPTVAAPGSNAQKSTVDVGREPAKTDPAPVQPGTPPATAEKPAEVAVPLIRPAPPEATSAPVEPALPSADLVVYFDFASTTVGPQAAETLAVLGRALSDTRLAKGIFLIAGHTDAKGKADYNANLSQRRAEAVRDHLITTYGVAPSRLVALGFGDTRLKDPQQPQSEVNRRVQVVNVTTYARR